MTIHLYRALKWTMVLVAWPILELAERFERLEERERIKRLWEARPR